MKHIADRLEIAQGNNNAEELIPEAITMLRQQQAREDSLCSMVKEYQDKVDELRTEIEALKAHPVKELNDGGEPVKNATYWKRQYNLMATQNDNLKSGLYHANEQIKYLESHPVEEQEESFDRTASHMAGEYVSWTSCVACGKRVTSDSIHTCSPQLKQLTDEEIIESLAELEHEQWMKWADTIMQTEKISDARFARWASCMIPYAELTEEMKEFDRVWARKALAILRKAQ